MPASKANQKAVAKYEAKVYDKVLIRIKKGTRDLITDLAKEQGNSLNGYIKKAVSQQYKDDSGSEIEL